MSEPTDTTSQPLSVADAGKVFAGVLGKAAPAAEPTKKPVESQETAPESPETEVSEAPESTSSTELPEGSESQGDGELSSESETTETPEGEQPTLYTIKVDGVDRQVTLEEALKGYSRTEDYTRKTQALSEKTKAFQEHEQAVQAERQRIAEQLGQLEEALTTMVAEPDWDKLRTENPELFADTWAAWQAHQADVQKVSDARKAAQEKVQQDQQAAVQSYLQQQTNLLLEKVPEWKDTKVAQKESSELKDFAKTYGFSDADVEQVSDHRLILLLRDAMHGSRTRAQREAVREKVANATVTPPGTGNKGKKAPPTEFERAKKRLAETGSLEDAAAVFSKFNI